MNRSVGKFPGLANQLVRWLRCANRIVIMGIGNPVRRDDFVGMKVVRRLKRTVLPNVHLIETGEVPESYLGLVEDVHPTHVLMIDAAEMGAEPGLVKLVLPSKIAGFSLSTHTLPLSVISEYLAKRIRAKIALLAVQPKDLDFGEGLSHELTELVGELSELIVGAVKLSKKSGVRRLRLTKPVRKRLVR